MQYDFTDLRLFLHVVAEGSITGGAARANLSLPSASARVRALERHAGVELLVRERRGVRTTPAGRALARHARDVLDRAARLDGAIASYSRPASAPLSLLAGSSAMHDLVPRAVTAFLLARPHSDVDVTLRRSVETARTLADGGADLGIVLDDVAAGQGLRAEPLCDDSLVVVGTGHGVLDGRDSIAFAEAAEHPMVGLAASAPLQLSLDAQAAEAGLAPRYRTRAADLGTVVALAEGGGRTRRRRPVARPPSRPAPAACRWSRWTSRGPGAGCRCAGARPWSRARRGGPRCRRSLTTSALSLPLPKAESGTSALSGGPDGPTLDP